MIGTDMPPTGLEPVLLPSEGSTLSTELRGPTHIILAESPMSNKCSKPKYAAATGFAGTPLWLVCIFRDFAVGFLSGLWTFGAVGAFSVQ